MEYEAYMTTEQKRIDRPSPGLYRVRLVKGGRWLPARIDWSVARDPITGQTLDRSPRLRLLIAGDERDVLWFWPSLYPIAKSEFDTLVAGMGDEPDRPVDLGSAAPMF